MMPHLDRSRGLFIAVEANIGAGKTTFCELLAAHRRRTRKCVALPEPIDNPRFAKLLSLYYGNHPSQSGSEWDDLDPGVRIQKAMKRWAFTFQVHCLGARYRLHKLAVALSANGEDVIQDRSIFADGCFGLTGLEAGNMTEEEWGIYEDTFRAMMDYNRIPDVVVYLRTDPEECHHRMSVIRGREAESGVPLEYLEKIHAQHERLIEDMSAYTRVLILDWNVDLLGQAFEQINGRIDGVVSEDVRFVRDFGKLVARR